MIYALLFPLLSSVILPQDLTAVIDETSETVHREKIETRDVPHTVACNCVALARTKRPDLPGMDASMYKISTTTPFIGAVAKMYYPHSGLYHLAYVVDFGKDWIEILDSNYKPCEVTHRRVLLPDRILGYL